MKSALQQAVGSAAWRWPGVRQVPPCGRAESRHRRARCQVREQPCWAPPPCQGQASEQTAPRLRLPSSVPPSAPASQGADATLQPPRGPGTSKGSLSWTGPWLRRHRHLRRQVCVHHSGYTSPRAGSKGKTHILGIPNPQGGQQPTRLPRCRRLPRRGAPRPGSRLRLLAARRRRRRGCPRPCRRPPPRARRPGARGPRAAAP